MDLASLSGTLHGGIGTKDMTITFQSEQFAAFYSDAKAMIEQHWKEAASMPDIRKLVINEDAFLKSDAAGMLICVTARDDGKLVGYIIGYLVAAFHTAESKQGHQNYYFVMPDQRGNGVFKYLFFQFEQEAKARGASLSSGRQKLENGQPTNIPDRFFETMGYDKSEVVWKKRL